MTLMFLLKEHFESCWAISNLFSKWLFVWKHALYGRQA